MHDTWRRGANSRHARFACCLCLSTPSRLNPYQNFAEDLTAAERAWEFVSGGFTRHRHAMNVVKVPLQLQRSIAMCEIIMKKKGQKGTRQLFVAKLSVTDLLRCDSLQGWLRGRLCHAAPRSFAFSKICSLTGKQHYA